MLIKKNLFGYKNRLSSIFSILGTPSEEYFRKYKYIYNCSNKSTSSRLSKLIKKYRGNMDNPYDLTNAIDLLGKMFTYDPMKRISAKDAYNHDFLK